MLLHVSKKLIKCLFQMDKETAEFLFARANPLNQLRDDIPHEFCKECCDRSTNSLPTYAEGFFTLRFFSCFDGFLFSFLLHFLIFFTRLLIIFYHLFLINRKVFIWFFPISLCIKKLFRGRISFGLICRRIQILNVYITFCKVGPFFPIQMSRRIHISYLFRNRDYMILINRFRSPLVRCSRIKFISCTICQFCFPFPTSRIVFLHNFGIFIVARIVIRFSCGICLKVLTHFIITGLIINV